jgi:hypothetical protein
MDNSTTGGQNADHGITDTEHSAPAVNFLSSIATANHSVFQSAIITAIDSLGNELSISIESIPEDEQTKLRGGPYLAIKEEMCALNSTLATWLSEHTQASKIQVLPAAVRRAMCESLNQDPARNYREPTIPSFTVRAHHKGSTSGRVSILPRHDDSPTEPRQYEDMPSMLDNITQRECGSIVYGIDTDKSGSLILSVSEVPLEDRNPKRVRLSSADLERLSRWEEINPGMASRREDLPTVLEWAINNAIDNDELYGPIEFGSISEISSQREKNVGSESAGKVIIKPLSIQTGPRGLMIVPTSASNGTV